LITCPFCKRDFSRELIYEGSYWRVTLNENQYYLGRCMIILKRHLEDPIQLSKMEVEEIIDLTVKCVKVLREMFNPNLFNYAMLGNIVRHVHLHVIPRYSSERTYDGLKFIDGNWGGHYYPYPEFKMPEDSFRKLRDEVKIYWSRVK
jgi:diadenosine tetraphosphate (Ap4A) HIT family hydrolase